jgi:hypothetical protein
MQMEDAIYFYGVFIFYGLFEHVVWLAALVACDKGK